MTSLNQRILVVDDEPDLREILQRGLSRQGYECFVASSASKAASILEEKDIHLVLLDITMPGKPGTTFLPEIREQNPEIAVIMMTAIKDVDTAVWCMKQGAFDYATKPLMLAEVAVRAEAALTKRALMLENRVNQRKLSVMAQRLDSTLKQRKRELAALNSLFQLHMRQRAEAQEEAEKLKTRFKDLGDELNSLADIVGGPSVLQTPERDSADHRSTQPETANQ
jgi:putative two-component system response regulator